MKKIFTMAVSLFFGGILFAQTTGPVLWGLAPASGGDYFLNPYYPTGAIFKLTDYGSILNVCIPFSIDHPGENPRGALTQAANGKIYGVTMGNGIDNDGNVFRFDPLTNTYTEILKNAHLPCGSLTPGNDGMLYALDYWQSGIIRLDPDMDTAGIIFNLVNIPSFRGNIVMANNGSMYCLSTDGGIGGSNGTIHKFNPASLIDTIVYYFNDTTGKTPMGSLLQEANGKLYGTTSAGGLHNLGVLFSFDPANNSYKDEFDFDSVNGAQPQQDLIEYKNGKLYGMTYAGGANNVGVIYFFDTLSHSITKLFDFDSATGGNPGGNFLNVGDTVFYALTEFGGQYNQGVIFRFYPGTNIYTKIFDFNGVNGGNPLNTLMQAGDGLIYGMTTAGGDAYNLGTLFSFNPQTFNYTKYFDFGHEAAAAPFGSLIAASDNKLYGMTELGGIDNYGTIFRYDPALQTNEVLFGFNDTLGASPTGNKLLQAANYLLYGLTYYGGAMNNGVLFSFDPVSQSYTDLFNFDSVNGSMPAGSLIQLPGGKIYGMTSAGGVHNAGTVFTFSPSDNTLTKIFDFDSTNGLFPTGSLLLANDGRLYGMTDYAGPNGYGNIFYIDTTTNLLTQLYQFDSAGGASPQGSLIQANNGLLYGMTLEYGAQNYGTLFSFDPFSHTYVDLQNFTSAAGYPYGSLLQASDAFSPEVDVSGLSSGVYFIEINTANGIVRKKFMKI